MTYLGPDGEDDEGWFGWLSGGADSDDPLIGREFQVMLTTQERELIYIDVHVDINQLTLLRGEHHLKFTTNERIVAICPPTEPAKPTFIILAIRAKVGHVKQSCTPVLIVNPKALGLTIRTGVQDCFT